MSIPWIGIGNMVVTPGFTPDQLSGLQVWLKADAITGKNDGDAISQWDDSSGGAHHFTQGTGANQPLYKAAQQNGLPAVRFDGSNDVLQGGNLSALWPSAATFFVAYKNDQTGSSYNLFGISGVDQWWLYDDGTSYMGLFRTGRINNFPDEGMPSYGPRQTCIVSSASRYDYYNDGHMSGTSTASYSAGDRTDLGLAESRAMKGDVYEVIIYNSALSDTDRNKVEAYLATKWGISRAASSGTPTSISGCRLWLRADAITGLSDTNPVECWKDESGYAHDFDMRRTTSVTPLYRTNLYNGLPAVRFDGGNDTLRYGNMGAMDFPSAATLFVVFKPNSDNDYSMFSNTATNDHWQWIDGNSYLGTFRLPRIDGYPTSGNFGTTNTLMLGTIKSSASTYVAYKNGTSAGAQAASYPSSWTTLWQIGNGISGFNGDVMEIIAYNTALNDTDRGTIESYLNAKWVIF